jgi:type I restriction enzyme S subunit
MKQGWEIKKLGEVCKVIAGQSPEGKYYNSEGNGMPFYQGKKEYREKYIGEPTTWTTKITKEAEAGDILMSVRAPVGPVNFATQKICIGRGLSAIRAGKNIDKEFLFNYLIKHESEIEGNAGAVFNSINKTQIESLEIPLPPLPEQQRIVSILDECFAAIAKAKANAEQNLKNARELFESYLQGVFENGNWEKKELRELTTVLGDGLHGTPKYTIDGEYYFINGNNLNDGKIEFKENTKRVNIDEFNKHKKNLTNRTVLVSINGTLGNIAFYNGEKIILGKSACYFNLKENVDNGFVKYVLSSPYFINYAHREATGATIKNVSLKTMREFKVPLPPLKEQQTIVRQLDALRAETQKLEAIYQQKLLNLEELKKSVLQKAFAGELKTEKERIEERKKNKE